MSKLVKQKLSYFVKAVKAVCVYDLTFLPQHNFPTRREETEHREINRGLP